MVIIKIFKKGSFVSERQLISALNVKYPIRLQLCWEVEILLVLVLRGALRATVERAPVRVLLVELVRVFHPQSKVAVVRIFWHD